MAQSLSVQGAAGAPGETAAPPPSLFTRYGVSLVLVAAATGLAFVLEDQVGGANLALIFVLPVIAAATWFGWGPSLAATLAGVLSFDFFFTEPKFSLAIAGASDIWAAGLLAVIAASASAVAAQSRRRELAARRAADQAQALQALAHVVVKGGAETQVIAAAADTLHRIFQAPAVIFLQKAGHFALAADAGGAQIGEADADAARGVLESRLRARAETYPFEKSAYDFWPVATPEICSCVIGVKFQPGARLPAADAERLVEIIGAYLAVALRRGR